MTILDALPIGAGVGLAGLVGLWCAGRIAMLLPRAWELRGHLTLYDADGAVRAAAASRWGHLASGGRLHQITRHMLGLFHGRAGARLLAL